MARGKTPRCPTCRDQGYVTLNVPVGDERFGQAVLCPSCDGGPEVAAVRERQRQRMAALLDAAGLMTSARHDRLSWNNFEPEALGEMMAGKSTAIALAWDWANGRPLSYSDTYGPGFSRLYPSAITSDRYNALWLHGPSGTGKTALARLAYKTRLQLRGEAGVFVEWTDLYEAIKAQYGRSGDDNQSYPLLEAVANAPLLVLDDVGQARQRGPMRDDEYAKLWQIVNRRYTQLLPTLITSNLDRVALRDLTDAKLAGRLTEMAVICEMGGADLRTEEAGR